jgi:hypothetical protein
MRLEDFDNDEDKIIQDRLKQNLERDTTNDSWAILKLWLICKWVRNYGTYWSLCFHWVS